MYESVYEVTATMPTLQWSEKDLPVEVRPGGTWMTEGSKVIVDEHGEWKR